MIKNHIYIYIIIYNFLGTSCFQPFLAWVSHVEQEILFLPENTRSPPDFCGVRVFCKNDFMKKDRQHNGQQKKNKRTNNDPQNITQQGKDRATRTPQKSGGERVFSGRNNISCSANLCPVQPFLDIAQLQLQFSFTSFIYRRYKWETLFRELI
jgi:hypothetical protein